MSSVLGFVLSRAWGLCQGSDPPKGAEQLLAFIFDEVERRSGLLIANEGVPDRRVVLTRDVLHGTVLPEHHDVSDDGSWLSCVPVQPSNRRRDAELVSQKLIEMDHNGSTAAILRGARKQFRALVGRLKLSGEQIRPDDYFTKTEALRVLGKPGDYEFIKRRLHTLRVDPNTTGPRQRIHASSIVQLVLDQRDDFDLLDCEGEPAGLAREAAKEMMRTRNQIAETKRQTP